ncbi:hypothetical protein OAK33_05980 [Candidatus Thioglobus sp.]|nr:hypothetical protein [Candidatus Thioglobus sp.]
MCGGALNDDQGTGVGVVWPVGGKYTLPDGPVCAWAGKPRH